MSGQQIDILLVEDNPNDIELAMYAFTKNNLSDRIAIVRDGQEALEFVFSTGRYAHRDPLLGPRIILLDLKMPRVDGIQVLRQIKDHPEKKKIPVIALTTSSEFSDVNGAYLAGVNSYIIKPVDFEEFANAINAIARYWLQITLLPIARQ